MAAGLASLKASLSSNGLGGTTSELAVSGLPSLAGLMDTSKKHRAAAVWPRSKDVSTKRPASEKQLAAFDQRMRDLRLPPRVLPTERNVALYNQCRAHVVLLVELESKLEKLDHERSYLMARKTGAPDPNLAPHGGGGHGGGQHAQRPSGSSSSSHKRSRDDHHGGSHKRSHH